MPVLHMMGGMKTDVLLGVLARNGFGLKPDQLLRVLFLLQSSLASSFFSFLERRRYGPALEALPLPDDPVIIVGHWRTGTTFLHQLVHLDPEVACPTVFQCALPDSLLVSRRYMGPLMGSLLAETRPMDNVRIALDEPQEDEFALMILTGRSPLVRLFFPESDRHFLDDFGTPSGDDTHWEEALKLFVKKLRLLTGKRIVLKNPFHSMRIEALSRLFPRARFIHIHRDPLDVVPSTVKMWTLIGERNCLKGRPRPARAEDVITVFDRTLTRIRRAFESLDAARFCEVSYEELERRPVEVVQSLYARLGIPFVPAYERRLRVHLSKAGSYRKNSYALGDRDRETIRERLRHHRERYGYEKP